MCGCLNLSKNIFQRQKVFWCEKFCFKNRLYNSIIFKTAIGTAH